MPRILVTGGSGFIGTNLIQSLQRYGKEKNIDFEIRAMDLKRPDIPGVKGSQGSILDGTDLSEAAQGCDYIIHLAALLGVKKSESRRLDCLNINIQGTLNVLNVAVQERVKKVLFASSSEVYGDQQIIPISENNPVNPKSVYAVSKLAGEEYVKAYCSRYPMDFSIVRFFNVYGPGQVGEFVLPRFIKAIQDGQSPVVYGDGSQRRAFCYVEDISAGVIQALFSPKANGETFNIGNDREPISMIDLANTVTRVLNRPDLSPKKVPHSEGDRSASRDIQDRRPDISKARKILGYEPRFSLEEGIKRMNEHGAVVPTWTR